MTKIIRKTHLLLEEVIEQCILRDRGEWEDICEQESNRCFIHCVVSTSRRHFWMETALTSRKV